MTPQRPIKIFCGPKWAPPLSIGAITARLVQLGPPRKSQQSRNSLAHFQAQNRCFRVVWGAFYGPPAPHKNIFWAKMGPTIVHRTNIFYSSPLWTFLDSWNIIICVRTQKCFFMVFWGPVWTPQFFFSKMDPTIIFSVKNCYTGPI